jgi:hypothetical protein
MPQPAFCTGGLGTNASTIELLRGKAGMNVATVEIPTSVPFERTYVLPKIVSAIQILPPDEGERMRLGLITQLPEGAEIFVGGPGFSEKTLKVQCQGASYFVFLDDLELVRKSVAMMHV